MNNIEKNKLTFTQKIKTDIAREVKKQLKADTDYSETAIMYDNSTETLFVTNTGNIDRLSYQGYKLFAIITHYDSDGKITIKNLKEQIFNTK